MTALAFALYSLALVLELLGVVFVIIDTRREVSKVKGLGEYSPPAVDMNHRYHLGGGQFETGQLAGLAFKAEASVSRIREYVGLPLRLIPARARLSR